MGLKLKTPKIQSGTLMWLSEPGASEDFILCILDFITVTNSFFFSPPYLLMEFLLVCKNQIPVFYIAYIFVALNKYLFNIYLVPDMFSVFVNIRNFFCLFTAVSSGPKTDNAICAFDVVRRLSTSWSLGARHCRVEHTGPGFGALSSLDTDPGSRPPIWHLDL